MLPGFQLISRTSCQWARADAVREIALEDQGLCIRRLLHRELAHRALISHDPSPLIRCARRSSYSWLTACTYSRSRLGCVSGQPQRGVSGLLAQL